LSIEEFLFTIGAFDKQMTASLWSSDNIHSFSFSVKIEIKISCSFVTVLSLKLTSTDPLVDCSLLLQESSFSLSLFVDSQTLNFPSPCRILMVELSVGSKQKIKCKEKRFDCQTNLSTSKSNPNNVQVWWMSLESDLSLISKGRLCTILPRVKSD
jgi:hypothetical protein